MERITLYYRQGPSDKVYEVSLAKQNGGYVVNFAHGRRGATLLTGSKTPLPVPYAHAKRIYDKLIGDKLSKGYSPGENGTPYQHTELEQQHTSILPQLLNEVGEAQVQRFIADDDYISQEKFDGRRLILRKAGDAIDGINRRGLICGIPSVLVDELREVPGDCLIDGECIGEVFWAFDILMIHGRDIRSQPYRDRLFALAQIVSQDFGFIKLADTAAGTAEKSALLERMKSENREGVVFKRLDAPYTPGRPNFGGAQFKFKLHATASFIVGGLNTKRSVSLTLFDGDKAVPAGNVTIPPNHRVPAIGAVVEVRYLYAFRESGCIFQPIYLGERTDIDAKECTVAQLKYKAAEETPAAV